jgi:integrase
MADKRITVWVQKFNDRSALVLQWIDPETGRRKSKSAETDDSDKAEDARTDLEYELNHGKYQEPSKLDWDKFREMFETEYLAGLRITSREKYVAVLDVFEQITSPTKLRSITERTISSFVKGMRERKQPNGKMGLAPITIHNYLIAFKTALKWAAEQKLLTCVPKFPGIKVPKRKPRPIPPQDFERLLTQAPDEFWKAFLLCGWYGGLRLSEARHLRWNPSDRVPWIDMPNNRIVVPAVFAKSAEDQWVPLHPVLREALDGLPRGGDEVFPFYSRYTGEPLTRNGITSRVIGMAERAGVNLSMHRLRKGFGCRVAKQLGKGNAPILHSLMRHSSMQITVDYYASVDDALQDAIKGLV